MPGLYLPSEEEFDLATDDFVLEVLSKERRYKHFDLPHAEKPKIIEKLGANDAHRFLPLLGFTDETRRYVKNSLGVREVKIKKRQIRFASHGDAAYLQSYADYLTRYYEQALSEDRISHCVLAYRKGGGTNIHHAKAMFDEIVLRGDCAVFAMDISGFFDCLDHIMLRGEIGRLIGSTRLDGHHGSVWKNITRYAWVETDDLDKILGRNRNARGRICTPSDFSQHVKGKADGLVQTHDLNHGIPQGTPVSGLYANIYLRTFDNEMNKLCHQQGGSYRRYSDDIAVILPLGAKRRHVCAIVEKVLSDFNLAVSMDKTECADFKSGLLVSSTPIQYLGFTFDGREALIRSSSVDAFRSKMRRSIRAKLTAAKAKAVPSAEVFKRESLARYTHLGKRRNFLRYAYKAAEIMGSPAIRKQVSRHMTWFNRAWDRETSRVYDGM
jgi:hypothetical protein